nr:MAG TPA: hypothetical protein [Caudoviricetes sp.]
MLIYYKYRKVECINLVYVVTTYPQNRSKL